MHCCAEYGRSDRPFPYVAPICMHHAAVPPLIHLPCVQGCPSVFHRPCIAHTLLVCDVWKVPKAFTYTTTICMHNAVVTISDPPPVFQFVHLFSRTTHCPCMVGVWCMEGPQGLHIHDNSMHAQCCGPPPTFLSLKSACLKVSVCSPLLVILNTHTHCLQSQKPTLSLTLSPYS